MAVEVLGVVLWDRRGSGDVVPSAGVVLECCPCVLCLHSPSQAIKGRFLVPWASPSLQQEGLEVGVPARALTAWTY